MKTQEGESVQLREMEGRVSIVGDHMCVPCGTDNKLPYEQKSCFAMTFSRKLESECWKDISILIPVHSRVIHKGQAMESSQESLGRWDGLRKCAIFGWCNVSQLEKKKSRHFQQLRWNCGALCFINKPGKYFMTSFLYRRAKNWKFMF